MSNLGMAKGVDSIGYYEIQDMYSVHKKRLVTILCCFRPTVGGAEPSSSSSTKNQIPLCPEVKRCRRFNQPAKRTTWKSLRNRAAKFLGNTILLTSWHFFFHWLWKKMRQWKTILWQHAMRVQKRRVVILLVSELIYVLKVSSSW